MENQRQISYWDITQLIPGEHIQDAPLQRIRQAQLVLLMISPDGVADDHWLRLMELAVKRQSEGAATLMPILLRPTFMDGMAFAEMATLPGDGKAVTAFKDRSAAWNKVLKAIRAFVQARLALPPPKKSN